MGKGLLVVGIKVWQWKICWYVISLATLVRGWSMAVGFQHRKEVCLADEAWH